MITEKVQYPNRAESLILGAIGRFRFLSAFQLKRLLYPNSISHVQTAVASLVKQGYLTFLPLPNYQLGGRNRRVYYLTVKGYNALKSEKVPASFSRVKPSYNGLNHSLAINDVLVAAHRLAGYTLLRFQTEFELKVRPINGLCPDAVVILDSPAEVLPLVIEVDYDTEPRKFFKEKVGKLIRYTQHDYRDHLNYEGLLIVVIEATGNTKRADNLRRWTEQELTAVHAESLKDTFYFASFNTDRDQLSDLFLESIWHTPFSEQPTPLLS